MTLCASIGMHPGGKIERHSCLRASKESRQLAGRPHVDLRPSKPLPAGSPRWRFDHTRGLPPRARPIVPGSRRAKRTGLRDSDQAGAPALVHAPEAPRRRLDAAGTSEFPARRRTHRNPPGALGSGAAERTGRAPRGARRRAGARATAGIRTSQTNRPASTKCTGRGVGNGAAALESTRKRVPTVAPDCAHRYFEAMLRSYAASLRTALWTARAVRAARRQMPIRELDDVALPPAPAGPPQAVRGMTAVLSRTRSTCLVRAAVRQAWYAAQGAPRDLVVGVTAPSEGFRAHAWLDGDEESQSATFVELCRRSA